MPAKSRTIIRPRTYSYLYKGAAYCNQPSAVGIERSSFQSVDVLAQFEGIRNESSEGRARFNDCDHWKVRTELADGVPYSFNDGYVHNTLTHEPSSCSWNMPSTWICSQEQPTDGITRDGLFHRDYDQMLHTWDWKLVYGKVYKRLLDRVTIKRQISILNFLYELREVMKMFDIWKRKASLLHNLASGKLNFKYGWLPFLQDVVVLQSIMESFRANLKTVLKNEGKIRRLRGNVSGQVQCLPIAGYGGEDSGTGCIDGLPSGSFVYETNSSWDHTLRLPIHYTVKYSYSVPELSDIQAEARAFCDAFGLQMDPQIIWDAIPFTFVVDWFFKVGEWLNDRFAIPNFPVYLRIHEACFSWKLTQRTSAYAYLPIGDINAEPEQRRRFLAHVLWTGQRYGRKAEIPLRSDLSFAGWTGSALDYTLTGLSLLVTNKPRPKPIKRLPRWRKFRPNPVLGSERRNRRPKGGLG